MVYSSTLTNAAVDRSPHLAGQKQPDNKGWYDINSLDAMRDAVRLCGRVLQHI
jgi:hypothetical protein